MGTVSAHQGTHTVNDIEAWALNTYKGVGLIEDHRRVVLSELVRLQQLIHPFAYTTPLGPALVNEVRSQLTVIQLALDTLSANMEREYGQSQGVQTGATHQVPYNAGHGADHPDLRQPE